MSNAMPSVLVHAEKNTYKLGDSVIITIIAKAEGQPAPHVPLKLYVFDPTGKKVFQSSLHTNINGKAMANYQLKKTLPTGNYYLEAQNKNRSVALSSFIVLQ
ncbi:MAG TPA: MG2 domain-containing protein [Oscillospiraceae bacterium]|nr:MG2 domain-containing protein [Oscillospiraceae bacterium]